MSRIIGSTSRWTEGSTRNKFIQISYADSKEGIAIKRFDGVRHPEESGRSLFVPKEQLTEMINLLIRAERELRSGI